MPQLTNKFYSEYTLASLTLNSMIMYLPNSIILHVYEVFGKTYFRLVSK